MDRFFDQQNIERYRQLASASTSEAKRKSLLTLLAAENAEFKRGMNTGLSQPLHQFIKMRLNVLARPDEFNQV